MPSAAAASAAVCGVMLAGVALPVGEQHDELARRGRRTQPVRRRRQRRADRGAVLDHADLARVEVLQQPAVVERQRRLRVGPRREEHEADAILRARRRRTRAPPTFTASSRLARLPSSVKSSASMLPETSTASTTSTPSRCTVVSAVPSCGRASATTTRPSATRAQQRRAAAPARARAAGRDGAQHVERRDSAPPASRAARPPRAAAAAAGAPRQQQQPRDQPAARVLLRGLGARAPPSRRRSARPRPSARSLSASVGTWRANFTRSDSAEEVAEQRTLRALEASRRAPWRPGTPRSSSPARARRKRSSR